MSQFFEYVKIAFFNIKSNKMRSILTMLGIIIGISSVVLIVSAGNGVKNGIYNMLNDMMGGQVTVYTDASKTEGVVVRFDESDLKYLKKELPHLKGISPAMAVSSNTFIETRTGLEETSVLMESVDANCTDAKGFVRGRFFTQEECDSEDKVCVIKDKDARTLFGTTDVIGMTLEVNGGGRYVNYRIIGVRKTDDSKLAALFSSSRIVVEVPYTLMKSVYGLPCEFGVMYLFSEDAKYTDDLATTAVNLLEARHNVRGQDAIGVENYESEMQEFNTILTTLTGFIGAVAMISLLVGGIGVMNIMLVSVAERTREIGVRKALGAKTAYILFQFLMEGSILSLVGGVIGILLGFIGGEGICFIASKLGSISIVADFNPAVITGAALFSALIGIFFSWYPAKKAAKLNPIEALRHE